MKNKGMFMAICLVIVAGVLITFYTSRATKHSADMAAGASDVREEAAAETMGRQEESEEAGESTAAAAPMMAEAYDGQAQDGNQEEDTQAPAPGGMGDQRQMADESVAPQQTEAAKVIISPLSGSMESITPNGELLAEQDAAADYGERLEEIDNQIKKARTENTDSNTYSVKNTADYEFRLWDGVLNEMYTEIMDQIDDKEKEELKKEEREWMVKRDAAAREAANKYNGGVLEGVEYTASMAASTRERAYELLEEYGALLGEK